MPNGLSWELHSVFVSRQDEVTTVLAIKGKVTIQSDLFLTYLLQHFECVPDL